MNHHVIRGGPLRAALVLCSVVIGGCHGTASDSPPGPTLDPVGGATKAACDADGGCPPTLPPGAPEGIYVTPNGSDSGLGTPDAPLKTIAKGIAAAVVAHKPVLLCAASFVESVALETAVTIHGGLDCANGWKPTTERATIAPLHGTPLTIRNVAEPVTIDQVVFKAPDASEASTSSIAAEVIHSDHVDFDHVVFQAGRAGDGTSAGAPAVADPAPNGTDGESLLRTECTVGDENQDGECWTTSSGGFLQPASGCGVGGAGGRGANVSAVAAATPGATGAPASVGGVGGVVQALLGSPGFPGHDGAPGADGTSASAGIGQVTELGYAATNAGTDGEVGAAGGGGGGGAGGDSRYGMCSGVWSTHYFAGGGGGQGGVGGCGGGGGRGAGAGGASIALLSIASHVSIRRSSLDTGQGGRGGDSASGGAGQPGGQGGRGGGSSIHARAACMPDTIYGAGGDGGPGGRGGRGGRSGAGGGGPSIGILVSGGAPELDAVVYNVGKGGKGGRSAGIAEGDASVLADGADGVVGELITLGVADTSTN